MQVTRSFARDHHLDLPSGQPSIEEAEKLVAQHRKLIERSLREDQYADGLAVLKHSQQERRVAIERERVLLSERQQQQRVAQQHEQRARRDTLRANCQKTANEVRLARYRDRPTGLAAFLGRVSGIERIRKILHRRDDASLPPLCATSAQRNGSAAAMVAVPCHRSRNWSLTGTPSKRPRRMCSPRSRTRGNSSRMRFPI